MKVQGILELVLLLAAAAAFVFTAGPVAAAGEGMITGHLVNGTANGSPVAGIGVALLTSSGTDAAEVVQDAVTDASGYFEFKGLDSGNVTYTVKADFGGVPYTSPPIVLDEGNLSRGIELEVYDSTTSAGNITVANGHMVVYVDQGDLEVLEIWRFSNNGDRTFVGTGGPTLRFSLPSTAVALYPGPGPAVSQEGNEAVTGAPVPPGFVDVNFSYFIPYQRADMTVVRQADYDIDSFSLLVQDAGVKISSSTLTEGTPQMMNGTNFLYFTRDNVDQGLNMDATFSGMFDPSAGSSGESFSWLWLLAAFGMLGVVAVAYYRTRGREVMPLEAAASDDSPESFEDGLLTEIAGLDDDYGAGVISEEEYRARRTRLKSRLKKFYDLTRRM